MTSSAAGLIRRLDNLATYMRRRSTLVLMAWSAIRHGVALVGLVSLLGASPRDAAAAGPPGFDVNRFDPSSSGSDWFANESLDLRGSGRVAVGLVGDYGYKPFVLYNGDGSERSVLVRHQLFGHFGVGIVLFDRLRLDASLPVAFFQDGGVGVFNGVAYSSNNDTTLGDARVGADLRLVGEYGSPFSLALGVQARLPTGDDQAYTGDGSGEVRVGPRAMIAGDVGAFTYAARVAEVYRSSGQTIQGLGTIGSEFQFGAAAGLRVADKHLTIGPEVYGATVTQGDVFAKRTTPVELLVGGHYHAGGGFRLGLGGGPGLTRGVGEPEVRLLASVEWMPDVGKPPPPPPPSDRDGDGVPDMLDACPDVPGVASNDPKQNGCPPPDRDKDGILDANDACPDFAGPASDDPAKNGCPDRDKDGILDKVDACPDDPGVPSDDPAKNGCPDKDKDGILDKADACPDDAGPPSEDPTKNGCPDKDKDGIIDKLDACPDQAGPADPDPKKNGCPIARVEAGQIKITQQVKFATGSARILPESDTILNAVKAILVEHPEITRVSVEGHTDNKGARPLNMKLSSNRAASVVAWLVKNGIDKKRLESHGYGPDKPIDTNATDEGRQNNRRVELHILEGAGATKGETEEKK
jgi:outer membrane protein OmpA-like peptidoglycan-associated protein